MAGTDRDLAGGGPTVGHHARHLLVDVVSGAGFCHRPRWRRETARGLSPDVFGPCVRGGRQFDHW